MIRPPVPASHPLKPLMLLAGAIAIGLISGCASYEVRSTVQTAAERLIVETPDQYLLDVAIEIFDPDLEGIPADAPVFSQVREAESIWVAHQLKTTLEHSNAWGAVRITPDEAVIMDLKIDGQILQSDGETLILRIDVSDQTGRTWIAQDYTQIISKYAYDSSQQEYEPFQGLYNSVSNDLLEKLRATGLEQRRAIRAVSSIRFAQSFAPEAFNQYLVPGEEGYIQVDRLPADNDPMLIRVQDIQARDHLFVDVLQDYYYGFSRNMEEPYHAWRSQSYHETQVIRELENSAKRSRIAGWVAILGGAAAAIEGNDYYRTAGAVSIMAGLQALRSSYARRDEANLHIETLSELGQSLEEELAPSVIELQDRTITLTGTVRDQYAEWRELLSDMYYAETGYVRPEEPTASPYPPQPN